MSRSPRCGPTPAPPPTRTTWSATSSRAAAARCWTPRWTRAGSCARATRSGARRCRYGSSPSPYAARAGSSGSSPATPTCSPCAPRAGWSSPTSSRASDLAQMIAAGSFPFPGQQVDMDASPRVGDGLIRLDADGVVQYASPNALSAYHRLGLASDLVGHHLGKTTAELAPSRGPVDEALVKVASGWAPREFEVEGADGVIQLRAIPLKPKGTRIGSLVLLRDVTELRRRERELITKDATIREIHHRVKNNLQTVAALLRLQARRMDSDAGPRGPRTRRCAASVRSPSCTRRCPRTWTSGSSSTRSPTGCSRWSPRSRRARSPAGAPAASASSTRRSPPRCPWCSPRSCRTPWSTRFTRGRPRHGRGLRGPRRHHGKDARLLITVQDDGVRSARGLRPAARRQPGAADRTDAGGGRVGRHVRHGPGARSAAPRSSSTSRCSRRSSRRSR